MNSLFHFSFDNFVGFLIAFLPALCNLALLLYILFFLPRIHLTNIFALFTVTVFVWQLDDSIGRIVVSSQASYMWDCILCSALLFIAPLCLHFSMLYTQIIKSHSRRLFILLLYIPSFVFAALYQMHYYEHIFEYQQFWGWVNAHNQNIVDIIQIYWIAALVISAVVLLFVHTFSIKNNELLKRQSFFITVGIAIPAIAGIITQVIFPTVLQRSPIPLVSTFLSCFSIATVLALKKFKLFRVSDLMSGETLVDSMPLIVVSVSTTGMITYINRTCREIFGLKNNYFIGRDINEVFKHGSEEETKIFDEALKKTIEKKQ